jgi:hypothetical protein
MITEQDLQQIQSRETLFAFLKEHLGWGVEPEDPYVYEEPSLAEKAAVKVNISRLVPFTGSDPVAIFLLEFSTSFRRTDLRIILKGVRARIRTEAAYGVSKLEELVFVCAEEGYSGLSFCHFTEREGRQPKLSRFGFTQDAISETRTLREKNLPALQVTNNLYEIDWKACYKTWMMAWDVEKVTKAFFNDYTNVFALVETLIVGVEGDRGEKRLFTQRLFNRLMFIHFLSKKGWLEFGGRKDYLHALWEGRDKTENFYTAHLAPLFFTGLNNSLSRDLAKNNPAVFARIGNVPFLNGGLFERDASDKETIQIPDTAIQAVLGLFSQYHFTITESTPDDVDVAVDPEMLGKVFEELVTGRHESGSYYTPRPIVAFMCRESLKGYLASATKEKPTSLAAFVDAHDADNIEDSETVLSALETMKIVDPACGSGAYLLGMLQEIIALRRALFASKKVDAVTDYKRKREIIQNNLYGVDKDEFAVNTARLRLWLSLTVEFIGDTPEPLPNLDFKIETGDSLLAPNPQDAVGNGMFRSHLLDTADAIAGLKAKFLTATGQNKADLRVEILAQEASLKSVLTDAPLSPDVFDWRVRFAEVFQEQTPLADIAGAMNFGGTLAGVPKPGGFDIVLANPPFVRQELIGSMGKCVESLKICYPEKNMLP